MLLVGTAGLYLLVLIRLNLLHIARATRLQERRKMEQKERSMYYISSGTLYSIFSIVILIIELFYVSK